MKYEPGSPVPPWRVGEFKSSADPRKLVLLVAVGNEEIGEYGAHHNFVRWMSAGAEPLDTDDLAYSAHEEAMSFGLSVVDLSKQYFKTIAQRALCGAPALRELTDEDLRRLDDETPFHESPDWNLRFARKVLAAAGVQAACGPRVPQADLIRAVLDGATVQEQAADGTWMDFVSPGLAIRALAREPVETKFRLVLDDVNAADKTCNWSELTDGFDGSAVRVGPNHSTIEIWYDTQAQARAARRVILGLIGAAFGAPCAYKPVAREQQ